MPIKRAGPFATMSNPYADAPMTPDESVVPVNCNKHQSATWPWRAVVRENVEPAYISTGAINITAPEVVTEDDSLLDRYESRIELQFAYQATQEWSFSGSSYEATATGQEFGVVGPSVSISVEINGIQEFADSETGETEAEIDGNIDSVVFPASVVPAFVRIFIIAESVTETPTIGSASAKISLPLAQN